jgi:hypothetical protein
MTLRFTTDPNIAYQEGLAGAFRERALSPIEVSQNPYANDVLARALQKGVDIYSGYTTQQSAADLKRKQEQAQSDILSSVLAQSQTPTGPKFTIRNDGSTGLRYIPSEYTAPTVAFTPEQLKAAGTTSAAAQLSVQQQQELAKKRFTDKRTIELQRALIEAEDDETRDAIRLAIDPVGETAPRPQDVDVTVGEFGHVTIVNKVGGTVDKYAPASDGSGNLIQISSSQIVSGAGSQEETRNSVDEKSISEKKPADVKGKPYATENEAFLQKEWDKSDIASRQKRLEAWPEFHAAFRNAKIEYDSVLEKVERAMKIAETNPASTGRLSLISGLDPESGASELEDILQSLRAGSAFTTLQNMRQASKTGGALGAVSERELELLIAKQFEGKRERGKDTLIANLKRYKKWVMSSRGIAVRLNDNVKYLMRISGEGQNLTVPESGAASMLEEARKKYRDR